jgi:hypothetical protein
MTCSARAWRRRSSRKRLVIEHLLERFEARGGPRGSRALGAWEQLPADLARGIPSTTTLVFFGQPFLAEGRPRAVTKTNPLVEALAKLPDVLVEEHPALEKENLLRYIQEEAALRGIRFKRGGVFESHGAPAGTDRRNCSRTCSRATRSASPTSSTSWRSTRATRAAR